MRQALVVAGVRPQYVKAPKLVELLRVSGIGAVYIDARQHYDSALTEVVQTEYEAPDLVLKHPSKARDSVAASIYKQLCSIFSNYASSAVDGLAVVVMGDTTTTFMAAAAAVRTGISLVHVEAGIRSEPSPGARPSIENHYRRMIGQVSDLNLCVLKGHVGNLEREGAPGRAEWVGDLAMRATELGTGSPMDQVLCHIHKAENMNAGTFPGILQALGANGFPTLLIEHPASRGVPFQVLARAHTNIQLISPVPHSELLALLGRSRVVVTDSGSVQRESAQLHRRCVVRRDSAGWSELFVGGGHVLTSRESEEIAADILRVWENPEWAAPAVDFFPAGGRERALGAIRHLLDTHREAAL